MLNFELDRAIEGAQQTQQAVSPFRVMVVQAAATMMPKCLDSRDVCRLPQDSNRHCRQLPWKSWRCAASAYGPRHLL